MKFNVIFIQVYGQKRVIILFAYERSSRYRPMLWIGSRVVCKKKKKKKNPNSSSKPGPTKVEFLFISIDFLSFNLALFSNAKTR
jgi:hypothetical protein